MTIEQQKEFNVKIDYKEILARKAARTLWGQGFNISSDEERVQTFLNMLKRTSKLENILYANEKVLSKNGRSIITMDRTQTGQYRFTIADPRLASRVGRVFVDEVSAIIWKRVTHDDRQYWIRENWDTMKVVRSVFLSQDGKHNVTVAGYNAVVPKHLRIDQTWNHNLGVLPVIEFHNLPDLNYDQLFMGYNPDDRAVGAVRKLLDETLTQCKKELILNRTRVLGALTPEKMAQIKAKAGEQLKMLLDDFIINVQGVDKEGTSDIEVLVANPQLMTYWDSFKEGLEFYFNASGYEWDKGETAGSATATGSMLGKQRDVETNKEKRQQRTIDVMRLIDRTLQCEGLMASPDDERNYVFEIKENIIVDEMSKANTDVLLVENKLKSRIKAIAHNNGGLSIAEAKEEMELIDQEVQEEEERLKAQEAEAGGENYSITDEEGNEYQEKTIYKALAFAKAKGFDTKTLKKG